LMTEHSNYSKFQAIVDIKPIDNCFTAVDISSDQIPNERR
jgi:hypothetical protein